jgi:uncharacterized protein YwgA
MNAYDFVHLALYALGGSIRGKTKLQKTIYFLGVLTDSLDELGFRPHFYGPYSAEVAGAVDRLRALGFVDQDVVGGGAVDEAGFEVARYDFRLNKDGKQMAQTKAGQHPEEWKRIKNAADVLKKVGEPDYVKLSIAAKTYFMLGERKEEVTRASELVALASRFGWSVTADQIREAAHFLESLKLVRLVNSN